MERVLSIVEKVNSAVNGFVWGLPMLILLVGTGILMTCLTKFFQITHIKHWIKNTIGGIFKDSHVTAHTDKEDTQISQFQSLCTALAATILPVLRQLLHLVVLEQSSGCGLLHSLE